jgi:polyhydroxyalkanoate synthase
MKTGSPPAQRVEEPQRGGFADPMSFWRRFLSYPRALAVAQETRVGTTPCEVVHESGTHRLLRYRRETAATWVEPVLLCYALINRPYILDLQPDKSVVRQYLAGGFEVYIIDWGAPRHGDRFLTLAHYVCGFLKQAVDHVRRERECEQVHLLGYCMGGTLSALFAALYPTVIKSLTLLAAPIDFAGKESLLNLWTNDAHFDVDAFVDAHGNCPGWFLQACFQCMKPVENLLEKNLAMFENIDDLQFIASYFAMELWINDNIPVAGETFRAFVKDFYQGNRLVRGEFHMGSERIDLARITCPLLLLMAKNDHLVPPPSTEGIRPHVGSRDVESMVVDAGHVGLVVGGRAQQRIWPEATRWLAERSTCLQSHGS